MGLCDLSPDSLWSATVKNQCQTLITNLDGTEERRCKLHEGHFTEHDPDSTHYVSDQIAEGPRTFRKKPVVIEALRWTGGNYRCLELFCGWNWARAEAKDLSWTNTEDSEHVVVWNTADQQWLQVPVGHWLIRGIKGELYPCEPNIFEATYEPAE
jgi:hypothetical protein